MKKREQILLVAVGGVVALFVLFFLGKWIIVRPLQEIDRKTAALRENLRKIQGERRVYATNQMLIQGFARQMFATNAEQVMAKSGEMLTRLLIQSGLRQEDFTRTPFGPSRLRFADEIGWSIQGEGKLADIVDLLFLLQESPYVHRLDGLTLTPGELPGLVRVSIRYLTLVVNPSPHVDLALLEPKFTLYSPERKLYDELVTRDIFRPYIKRPPPPPPPGTPPTRNQQRQTSPGAAPPPEVFKVVSLSVWGGHPEVTLRDMNSQSTRSFKIGDELAGGVIVMIDERPLPRPGKPGLLSMSRVILRIGTEYWAIELGQTLGDKYRLALEQLPENLSKL